VSEAFALSGELLPQEYSREPSHEGMIEERDTYVAMRDGVRLCVDVYRPAAPAWACSCRPTDLQLTSN
jgi:predicted acyl esterase